MDNSDSPTRTYFDRVLSGLHGIPDVTHTQPSTVRAVDFIGTSQTFIITTYRMREQGDTIFLEMVSGEGSMRVVLPPQVADAIARQREALTVKVRRKIGKRIAEDRKARGEKFGFENSKPRSRQAKKPAKK